MTGVKEKEKKLSKKKENKNARKVLLLYNDEVNAIDYVIECLVEICEHTYIQAEQATWIAHTKGKCAVKEGTYNYLKPMKDLLITAGLTAVITD